MFWRPIETAPRDGDVVLTNQGTAKFLKNTDHFRIDDGWYLSDLEGYIPNCLNNGISVSKIEPRLWMEIPSFSKN
jgi:hypothetical protein